MVTFENQWSEGKGPHWRKYGKAFQVQSCYNPREFQEFEYSTYLEGRHMKLVKLSSLRTSRLYLQEILLALNSV